MIDRDENGARVDVQVRVAASPEAVWGAITRPEEIQRWFPERARGDGATPGGLVEVAWEGDEGWWGMRVVEADPGRHLRLQDAAPAGEGAPVLFVDYHLSSDAGETVVRLVHSGFGPEESWNDWLDGLDAGWSYFLTNLKVYLERHHGTPRELARARPRAGGTRASNWAALLGAFGLDPAGFDGDAPVGPAGREVALRLDDETHPGVVEVARTGRTLGLRLPDLDDGMLLLEVEGEGEKSRVGIWLSTYGLAPDRVATLRRAVDAAAEEVVAAAPPA